MNEDRACISYWLPRLRQAEDIGVRVPRTALVHTALDLLPAVEGEDVAGWGDLVREIRAAAISVGGFPCFLRTGHGSGKHQWRETCFVASSDALGQHVFNLVEWSACASLAGLPTNVWAVREMLRLESSFTAFGGFPVNRERRYFIQGCRGVLCGHCYWPEAAVERGNPNATDWRARLAVLNDQTGEKAELTRLSEAVGSHFTGAWSLDWARDVHGRWWAIDMAPGELSYHWPGCPVGADIADAARGRRG